MQLLNICYVFNTRNQTLKYNFRPKKFFRNIQDLLHFK